MSPEVTAAIIAGSVSAFTLIVTLVAQHFGRRTTSRDTKDALDQQLAEQHKQLDRSLEEQRKQLDKTLRAQSDQLDKTLAEQRTRTLNERFATAAEQLGSDKAAVRLAGVYAMAGLADDWKENRQICVDVLCAYLRMPYEPDPGQDAPGPQRLAFLAMREVRHTVIRVITAHLRNEATASWQGLNFDFADPDPRGLVFIGPKGGRLRRSNFRKFWHRARGAVGLPELHFHDLRHTGNTMAAAQGATLRELMERMGHSSPRAALIYLHCHARA